MTTGLRHLAAGIKSATERHCLVALAIYGEHVELAEKALFVAKAVQDHLENALKRVDKSMEKLSTTVTRVESTTSALKERHDEIAATTKDMAQTTKSLTEQNTQLASKTVQGTYANAAAQALPTAHASTIARGELRLKQIIVDGVRLTGTDPSDTLSEDVLVEKANQALAMIKAPPDAKFKGVRRLQNGGLMYELSTTEAAIWLRDQNRLRDFTQCFGGGEQVKVKGRGYQVLIDFAPVQFAAHDPTALRLLEQQNDLPENSIESAHWIKPVEFRTTHQKCALLSLQMASPDAANRLVRDGAVVAGKSLIARKNRPEPKRCLKCQRLDCRHLAATCKDICDTCGTCGTTGHSTRECTVQDTRKYFCVNCSRVGGEASAKGHAAWSRTCKHFLEKTRAIFARLPEAKYKYFPTANDPTSWELIGAPDVPSPNTHNLQHTQPNSRDWDDMVAEDELWAQTGLDDGWMEVPPRRGYKATSSARTLQASAIPMSRYHQTTLPFQMNPSATPAGSHTQQGRSPAQPTRPSDSYPATRSS